MNRPSSIPYASVPGMSRSKQSVLNELVSTSDKRSHRCSFSINVEKRKIDGETKVVYCVNNYNYAINEPLKEEYTDVAKFADDVKTAILGIGKEL